MRNFLDKLRYSMAQFMYGRYGNDTLSKHMLILSVTLLIVSYFVQVKFLYILIYILLFGSIFRSYSKNISKRQMENEKYLRFLNKLKIKKRDKNYKYFKCKSCGQMMRVPKGKGKIEVRCPKCGNKEIKNS